MTIRLSQLPFLSAGLVPVVVMLVIGFTWFVPSGGQYWGIDLLEENADTTCYGVDVGKRRGRSFFMLY